MAGLYDSIFVRKSVRKYKKENLSAEQQAGILDFAGKAIPLYPGIKTKVKIVSPSEINTLMAVKAPHYLLIYSEKKEGDLLNAGVVLQQIDLYLSSQGIGSCWLGVAKPKVTTLDGLEYVIMLAIGDSQEPVYRESVSDFNRKPLIEISQGEDIRLEAARLAPSARNGQPWFFVCEDGNIKIYKKKPSGLLNAVFDRLTQIDVGIAMSHLLLASEKYGLEFLFDDNKVELPSKADYLPIGTVKS
jgi:Nitroreductase